MTTVLMMISTAACTAETTDASEDVSTSREALMKSKLPSGSISYDCTGNPPGAPAGGICSCNPNVANDCLGMPTFCGANGGSSKMHCDTEQCWCSYGTIAW
jgi:hypothetical protein